MIQVTGKCPLHAGVTAISEINLEQMNNCKYWKALGLMNGNHVVLCRTSKKHRGLDISEILMLCRNKLIGYQQ